MKLLEILLKMGDKDQTAFRDVYALTSAQLFAICLHICGDRSAAEDVLHDIYIIVWKRACAYDPGRDSPTTWLVDIARSKALEWRSAQEKRAAISLDEATDMIDDAIDAEAALLIDEATSQVFLCLHDLDSRHRDAIRDTFLHGFTHAELADRQRVPLGTMKSWIRRGLRQIRRSVETGTYRQS